MIKVTRFNGQELAVKEKILVKESVDEVIKRIIEYRRSIHKTGEHLL